jgi:carbohydrate kinase (thermoresistant glucokinase family)
MILIGMGVSGAGKTRIGEMLAERLQCSFTDGDAFHSAANKEKMHKGIPLTDEDRWPWLKTIRAAIEERQRAGETAVFTCSSLKRSYRDVLRGGDKDVCLCISRDPTKCCMNVWRRAPVISSILRCCKVSSILWKSRMRMRRLR